MSAAANGGGSSHLSLGLAVSCVPRVAALRFCPRCKAEDMADLDFTWWRRSHQLPGTLVCVRHGVSLCETPFGFGRMGRHEFLIADDRSCPTFARPLADDSPACLDVLLVIARREEEVLRSGVAGGSAEERRTRLAGAGIMRSLRHVDQMTMLARAAAFFAPAAACLPATSSPEALASWMPGLVRSTRRGAHPLLHVLMDAFLGTQQHVASRAVGPFGVGPWPCLNPLASHTGEAVVTDLTSYTTKGRVVTRFSCSCGYVYSRGLSADGGQTEPRLYHYGALLEPELRRRVGEGVSLRATGRALGLDPSTVVSVAKRLGLPVTWRAGCRVDARMGRTAAPPSTPRAAGAGPRRMPVFRQNWSTRDAETLGRCKHAAAELIKLEPPFRLTYAAIERAATGRTGWIRARTRRLPRTIDFIEGAVESAGAYKRRRAAFEIGRTDGATPPWRVMRAAGLTGVDLPMIRELMENTRPEILTVTAKPTVVRSKS